MDEQLKELHDLYDKHDPKWVATLLGPLSAHDRRLIVAVGVCDCNNGMYTSLTRHAPRPGEELKEWKWELAPIASVVPVGRSWRNQFLNIISKYPAFKSLHKEYINNRAHVDYRKNDMHNGY